MDILELYSKPTTHIFSEEEIAFIKSRVRRSSMNVKYCLYKKHSPKGVYIGFFIDLIPFSHRKSGIFNNWEVVVERSLSEFEYHEVIQNLGCNHRRFIVYMYRDIEALIIEDKKYNVETPKIFVEQCKRLGYTGFYQTEIHFNN